MKGFVTFHNKDTISKDLIRRYPNIINEVYGFNLPDIEMSIDGEMPELYVNLKKSDGIFKLSDDSYLILEYESRPKKSDLIKYMQYIIRLSDYLYVKERKIPKIKLCVVYTGDVKNTANTLDIESLKLEFKQCFLSKLNSAKIREEILYKINNKIELAQKEISELILLPLMVDKNNRYNIIEEIINIVKVLPSESEQEIIVTNVLAISDKFISVKHSKKLKELIKMTKIDKLYEMEKQNAIEEVIAEKDAIIEEVIAEKDAIIEEVIAEKDATIEEKDATIEEKDATIEEKDAIIEDVQSKSANILFSMNKTIEEIADILGITVYEITKLIK